MLELHGRVVIGISDDGHWVVSTADGLVVVNETSDCTGLLPCQAGIPPGWSMYENAVFVPLSEETPCIGRHRRHR